MKATNVLVNLPKGVKGVANLSLHVNGEWVKEINPGRMTARQMVKAAAKTANETKDEHVQVFMYFDCLCIGEVVCADAGVEVRIYSNEPTEEPTTPAPAESSELTHAGRCLDIYLMNTAEIYERYTLPAIAAVAKSVGPRVNWEHVTSDLCALNPFAPSSTVDGMIYRAIDKARRLVNQFDGLKPTASDIQQVTRNYVAYIVDCAKSELVTA